ncbi:unnamed protein product, partial [Laminaria digitata]
MRILSGAYQPDAGEIIISDQERVLKDPRDAYEHGIGMVYQEQSLVPNISVAENIYLGNESQFTRFSRISWKDMNAAARKQLAKVGLDIDPTTVTERLTYAQRQMIELAKVLTLEDRTDHRLLILLDEPTSVLEKAEIDLLFARVRALRDRASFIFVSHRLDEVLEISDRIYVMKDGEIVTAMAPKEATISELHQAMVGRSLQSEYYREYDQVHPDETVVLEADSISSPGNYTNVSFTLRAGDVLGIAGVVGAG